MDEIIQNNPFSTGWNNEPTLMDLKQDLDSMKSTHDMEMSRIHHWLDNLRVKSEEHKKKTGRSSVQPKLIRKNNEWRYTSLSEPFLNTPNIFKVEPVTAEDTRSAEQHQLILNNQLNTKIDKVHFIDRYVRKCVDEGTVIVRVGWDFKTEVVTRQYPVYEIRPTQERKHIADLERAAKEDPSLLGKEMLEALITTNELGIPYYPVQVDVEEVEDFEVITNCPTVEVCETENVYIDPSCNGDIDKAQFVIHSFETSLSDLEKAGIYKNLDSIHVNSPDPLSDSEHDSNWDESGFEFTDKARRKLVAYEYWGFWDVEGNNETTPIVATWVGNTLIRLEENPYPDKKIPFIAVPFLPVDGKVYGEPDGELLEDNQKIVGAVVRGMVDVMGRSANGQTGFKKGALDVVNKRKFTNGLDYEFNDVGDAQNSIYMHTYPEIPMSVYNLINMQQQEAESLTGVKAFNQGITGAGLGATATHAQGALDAAARRELGILRRLANGMRKIGRKIISMNQVFLSDQEIVRVTNERFITVRRDDLKGEYDLRLSIATAEADEQKAKELAFMLQTTGQQFGLEMYKLILSEIADLRKMPELAYKLRNYSQEPSQIEQLEAQKLQLEIQEQQLKNQKIQAEIQKIYAEAGNKQADTDRKNLDYLEQENGVNHARSIEKDQAQAKGNIELEAFKYALNSQPNDSQENP